MAEEKRTERIGKQEERLAEELMTLTDKLLDDLQRERQSNHCVSVNHAADHKLTLQRISTICGLLRGLDWLRQYYWDN